MKLNDKLSEMYQPHFDALVEQLKNDKIIDEVQPLFLLGLNREEKGSISIGDETWYTQADLKVMVFGREVHEWGWPNPENNDKLQSDDLVEAYEKFYSANYSGKCFLTDSESKLGKSPFFRTGFNGFMYGINKLLKNKYTNKKMAFLWNEISKLSSVEGISRRVGTSIHQYELDYFHVIPKEIELLKPDIVIFLTGFGEPYDGYIRENFTIRSTSGIGNISMDDVVKLDLEEVPLAYKTHHPGATIVRGRGFTDEEKWEHYNAILGDIAANFDKVKELK